MSGSSTATTSTAERLVSTHEAPRSTSQLPTKVPSKKPRNACVPGSQNAQASAVHRRTAEIIGRNNTARMRGWVTSRRARANALKIVIQLRYKFPLALSGGVGGEGSSVAKLDREKRKERGSILQSGMNSTLTRLPAWQALEAHRDRSAFDLRALFESDAQRFERHSIRVADLLLDYSKHFVTAETMRLLAALADARELRTWIERLTSGERINVTENRPALHTALRSQRPVLLDGHDVTEDVKRVRAQMRRFTDALRAGAVKGATGRAITDVINIGIGGSDLGPALAVEALAPYAASTPRVHFMSNVDGAHVEAVLDGLDPETTLAIVASKTFSTQETLTNAKSVRAWLERAAGRARRRAFRRRNGEYGCGTRIRDHAGADLRILGLGRRALLDVVRGRVADRRRGRDGCL